MSTHAHHDLLPAAIRQQAPLKWQERRVFPPPKYMLTAAATGKLPYIHDYERGKINTIIPIARRTALEFRD